MNINSSDWIGLKARCVILHLEVLYSKLKQNVGDFVKLMGVIFFIVDATPAEILFVDGVMYQSLIEVVNLFLMKSTLVRDLADFRLEYHPYCFCSWQVGSL